MISVMLEGYSAGLQTDIYVSDCTYLEHVSPSCVMVEHIDPFPVPPGGVDF